MRHFSEIWRNFVMLPVVVPLLFWLIYLRIQWAKKLNLNFWSVQVIRPPKGKEWQIVIPGIVLLFIVVVAVTLELLSRGSVG
jgi:hypothetical protein